MKFVSSENDAGASVSAVIPLYNKRASIVRAVASVLAQSVQDFELIIVDDGSTDESAELVTGIRDKRIKLIRQSNQGPGKARNVGAAASSAPLLAFLDADDEWEPDYLASGVKALTDNPSCVAYVCGYDSGIFRDQRPNKIVELQKLIGPQKLSESCEGAMLKKHVDAIHSSSTIIRKEVFTKLGGYFDKDRCCYGEDSFLFLQVLLSGCIYWDPTELVKFHVEDSSLGFAVSRRFSARPISCEFHQLEANCLPQYLPTLRRAINAFVEMDIDLLSKSGALRASDALRKAHSIDSPIVWMKDRLKYAKFWLKNLR